MFGLGLSLPQVAARRFAVGAGTIVVPVGARNFAPASTVTTAGGSDGATNISLRIRNNTSATLRNVRTLVYRIGYDAAMNPIRTADNVLEFRHALEIGGTRHRMQKGGSDDFVLPTSSDVALGDPLAQSLGPGAVATIRSWQRIPASTKYIGASGGMLAALGDGSSYGGIGSQPDRTLSGTPPVANSQGGANYLLFAEAPAGTKSALVIGDSIDAGSKEHSTFTGDADGHIGFANRLLASRGYNTINLAKPSSTAANWAAKDIGGLINLLLSAGVTFDLLWMGLGRNDYAGNATAATIKGNVEAVIGRFRAAFPSIDKVVVRDLPPTTSGDLTSVEGQNDRSGQSLIQEGCRRDYNAIVAAGGIAGQTHYAALAPAVEATKANGTIVWKANHTNDGVHPVAVANAAAAAANGGML